MMFLGGLAVLVSTAALAWACVPNAGLTLSTQAVMAHGQVTVVGQDFPDQPLELRWATATGPVLATVTPSGGGFRTRVTIPQAEADVYFIHAVGPAITMAKLASLEVVASPDAPGPSAGAQGAGSPSSVVAPAPATDTAPSTGAAPSTDAAPAPSTGAIQKRAASGDKAPGRRSEARDDVRRRTGTREGSTPRVGRRAPSGAIRTGSRAVTTRSGQTVFAASVAPPRRPSRAPDRSPRGAGRSPRPAPASPATDTDSEPRPSLTSDVDFAALDNGPDRRLAIGIALLALGIIVPLAGFLVAETRRRRAQVRPDRNA